MKLALVCSLLLHAVLGAAVIMLPQRTRFRLPEQEIRQVALIRAEAPAAVPEPEPDLKAASEPEPEPEPLPVSEKPEAVTKKEEKPPEKRRPRQEKTVETAVPDSAAAAGTQAGGSSDVNVASEDFPFNYYLSLIRYRIKETWRPPVQTPGDSRTVTAFIAFRIRRDGRVEQVALEKSSGRFLFDQAARRAVSSMRKLPPLPGEFSGDNLTVHIEFETTL